MRLWQLRIERFRGIRHLEWKLDGRLTCLVGAGDQCKTTILDAIGALGSTRAGPFTEADFHCATSKDGPIEIEAVLGDLPTGLLADNRFGLDLIGVEDDGTVHAEPGQLNPAIRIRLDVDATLEPVWRIVSARHPDGRPITSRDRAALKLVRVGTDPDRQFHLGRSSALLGLVSDSSEVANIVEAAYDAARDAVRNTDMTTLDPTVKEATRIGTDIGAGPAVEHLSVGLELSRSAGAGLSLQGSGIPVRAAGLGTRRLLAVGLELGSADAGALVCLDELEHGLEPHRITHLIRTLRQLVRPKSAGAVGGQVIFTTHSPIALGELGALGVSVVRTEAGSTTVRPVPPSMTPVVRAAPEALLGRRVIVAEGKTELGLLRAFDAIWGQRHENQALAHLGIALVNGGGTSAPNRASMLAELGYPTLLLADSDAELDPSPADLAAVGVEVVQWNGGMCSEERAFTDLSWAGVVNAFEALVELGHEPALLVSAIVGGPEQARQLAALGLDRATVGDSIESIVAAGAPNVLVRAGFAAAAKRKEWFKRIDSGEALGAIAAADSAMPDSPFGQSMSRVEAWCHG